jgi:hypothetical protein
VIETSGRTWAARPVGDGSAISNRISLSTDWTIASNDVAPGTDFDGRRSTTVPTALADHRLASTRACVAQRSAGRNGDAIAEVVATLRDHGEGPWGAPGSSAGAEVSPIPDWEATDFRGITVCMHAGEHQATTAAMVIDLPTDAPPRAWACLGSPCAGVFVPFFPPAVPIGLSDPAQWQRFARLRDRVQTEPDALAEARSVLAPAEDELWRDADECYAAGTHGPLGSFTAAASARVDAALTALGV